MHIHITPGRDRVAVGPPGGPTEHFPAACTIKITGIEPYDIELRKEWVAATGRLETLHATFTPIAGGPYIRLANISRIALADLISHALTAEYLGSAGWQGVIDRHVDHEQIAVDALVYLLAVGLDSPRPSATVATARGLSPASGPKRVAAARKAGLIPKTKPGRPAGA